MAAPRRAADGGGLLRRCGAPMAMGGGGWAWELRWGEVKPFPRSVGAKGGRRRGLHGEVGAAAVFRWLGAAVEGSGSFLGAR